MAAETELSRAGFERPVIKSEDDRYGFTAIADGLAQSISRLDDNISTVIGIEGQWGSGKTSLLHLLTEQLRLHVSQDTEIVAFSPWLISPDESPVNSLLTTIAARLVKRDQSVKAHASKLSPLVNTLLDYAQQTSRRIAPLARYAGKFISGMDYAADIMDTVANTDLTRREKTAAELRADIEQSIANLGVNFIVVIDDLDRLEPAQAIEILRMVRSVADFSRFRYVMCYDRDVLAHAVEKGLDVPDGRLYLQKIIPLSFAIPRPESFALRREFREGALSLWREVNEGEPDEEIIQLLANYVEVYGEALATPREVNQALNAVRFRYPGLRDYVFFPDLCLLQLLNTANPTFASWVELYLTEWSMVVNRDGYVSEEEQKALAEALDLALKNFGASRARSMWELASWLPGISGFNDKTVHLFQTVRGADAELANSQRRLCSSIYWRYYFSFSAPQNVMSDADIQEIIKLADRSYIALETRLMESVTTNGISSRTWFEHILTRLTPLVTGKSNTRVQRNLLKFFFRCSDRILPFYQSRDIFFRQEKTGIDGLVTQLARQQLATSRRKAMVFIRHLFGNAEAFGWAVVYLRQSLPAGSENSLDEKIIFTVEEHEQLRQALKKRLTDSSVQKKILDVPYLSRFLYAWQEIAGAETVSEWISGVRLNDREFLQMLLNLRTAVSSSNLGDYLRLNLTRLSSVFGISGLAERFDQIKCRRAPDLFSMIKEVEEAINLNESNQ